MTEKQEKILEIARSLIGPVHYQYQIKDDEVPAKLNCARFTQLIYKNLGIKIGPASIDQAADAGKEIEIISTDFKIGDLIFFEAQRGHYNHKRFGGRKLYIGHVVIYSGNGKIIHCFRDADEGLGEIKEESLEEVTKRKGRVIISKRVL